MEKPSYHEITFHDITKAQAERLREFLTGEPTGSCGSGNSGLAETSCFTAKYDYNPKSGLLRVEPIHLVPGLRGARFKRMIEDRVKPASLMNLDATTDPSPTPAPPCACYNRVFGYLNNQTDQALTYSTTVEPSSGNIIYSQTKIPSGQTAADQGENGCFQNRSPKDSGQGCYGTVTWDIDGAATLALTYGLNTLSGQSASVSISGANAKYYDASVAKRSDFYCACAYFYPTVTLKNVT